MSTTATESPSLSPDELAASIVDGWKSWISRESTRAPSKANNVYASSWHECARAMALNLVAGDRVKPFEADTLANFRRGKDRERNIMADFSLVGRDSKPSFEVMGHEERFELRDRKQRIVITGRVDGRLKMLGKKIPFEIKGWNPNTVARIEKFSDVFENPWTAAGGHQLLSYMYASEEEIGILLLDRHGIPKPIPVELNRENIDRMEDFLQKSEQAMDSREMIEAGGGFNDTVQVSNLLPAFCEDSSVCRTCKHFGISCNPTVKNDGANVITDEELLNAVRTAYETKEPHKIYEGAWNIVKGALRGKVKSIMPGFMIDGKWSKGSELKFPSLAEEIRYKSKLIDLQALENKYKVTKAEGRFILTVTKL